MIRSTGDVVETWWVEQLEYLRENGYSVAVHNDYRQGSERRTFWLLIDSEGQSYKGEGSSDSAAFDELIERLPECDRRYRRRVN